MLDNLGWRSLENRCMDSRRFMFYRIIYGYAAIQIPTYFVNSQRYTATCTLSSTDRSTPMQFTQSFYPATIVLRNKFPSEIVLMDDLDSFKEGVSKIKHLSARSTTCPLNFRHCFSYSVLKPHSALTL